MKTQQNFKNTLLLDIFFVLSEAVTKNLDTATTWGTNWHSEPNEFMPPIITQLTEKYSGSGVKFSQENPISLQVELDNFSMNISIMAASELHTEFKRALSATYTIKSLSMPGQQSLKSYDLQREAEVFNSLDEARQYCLFAIEGSKESIATAKNAVSMEHGLKPKQSEKLIEVFQRQLQRAEGILDRAESTDYEDLAHEKAARANPIIQEMFIEPSEPFDRYLKYRNDETETAEEQKQYEKYEQAVEEFKSLKYLNSRDIYDLFRYFNKEIVFDIPLIKKMQQAKQIHSEHDSFDNYLAEKQKDLTDAQQSYDTEYLTKAGTLRKLGSHRQRQNHSAAQSRIATLEYDIKIALEKEVGMRELIALATQKS